MYGHKEILITLLLRLRLYTSDRITRSHKFLFLQKTTTAEVASRVNSLQITITIQFCIDFNKNSFMIFGIVISLKCMFEMFAIISFHVFKNDLFSLCSDKNSNEKQKAASKGVLYRNFETNSNICRAIKCWNLILKTTWQKTKECLSFKKSKIYLLLFFKKNQFYSLTTHQTSSHTII